MKLSRHVNTKFEELDIVCKHQIDDELVGVTSNGMQSGLMASGLLKRVVVDVEARRLE